MSGMLYYLATPISSFKETKEEQHQEMSWRYYANITAVYQFMHHSWLVYSPMAHYFDMCRIHTMSLGWDFWQNPSFTMLDRCDGVIALALPGWDKSIGMTAELQRARDQGKPILWPALPLNFVDGKLDLTMLSLSTEDQLQSITSVVNVLP